MRKMKKCNVIKFMSLVLIGIISTFVVSSAVFAVEYTNVDNADDFESAIKEGKSVKLVEDIELSAPITITKENITIDLNGKILSYETDVAGEAMITNKGSLTITDTTNAGEGKVLFEYVGQPDTQYGKGNYTISNSGSLVLENGIIENATAKMSHASYAVDNNTHGGASSLTVNGGKIVNTNNYAVRQIGTSNSNTLTVNGGTITGIRAVWIQLAGSDTTVKPNVTLNVTGGNLIGTGESADYKLAVYSYSYGNSLENVKINISGGVLDGDVALSGGANKTISELVNITGGKVTDVYSYAKDEVVRIAISGGTFDYDVSSYVSDTYVVKNENGKYVVVENTVIETTDEKVSFESDEALSNEFVLVVEEATEEATEEVAKEVTEEFKDNEKVKDAELLALYEIDIKKDGVVQPMTNGNFKISIEIEETLQKYDAYKVVYINDEGEIEETLDAKLVDGKIVFETTHLSTYGIVGYNNVEVKNPNTGDSVVTFIVIGLMSLVAFAYASNKLRKNA